MLVLLRGARTILWDDSTSEGKLETAELESETGFVYRRLAHSRSRLVHTLRNPAFTWKF
jgi:hypothetical protein